MRRAVKILLAWFDAQDAVAAQLGFRLPEKGEDVSGMVAHHNALREAIFARPPFVPTTAILGPLPEVIASRGEGLAQVLQGDPNKGTRTFEPAIVDLTKLLSVQKAIALEEIENRVAAASVDDWSALADLCLALPDASGGDVKGTFDKDGKGMTVSSANPNMRVSPIQMIPSILPGGPQTMGFSLTFGTRHLHVMEYQGRFFLKDGYHRAFGLLSRGICRVPCIWEKTEHFSGIHNGGTTMISPDWLLGNHPPLVADYLNPEVSATASQEFFRKVIRIRSDEYVVVV